MKKIFLNESERKAVILDREKAIVENFAKTFNKIKRIDENEVNSNNVSPEAAVDKAMTAGNKLNNSSEMDALASKIASDPNLVNQLQKLITSNGVSLNEDQSSNPIDTNDIRTLALNFAKKQIGVSEEYRSPEERSYDSDNPEEDEAKMGMGFVGAFGGGFIGSSLSSVIIGAIPAVGSVFAGPGVLGALAGIALGVLAVKVYYKLKGGKKNNEISEMERFDATTYQEKKNLKPTPHGDKYNVQFEILYCNGSTCGNHMFHTVDVYANSKEEAIKLGNREIKVWEHNHAFNGAANEFDSETGEPNFKIESFQLHAIENESELDRGSVDENVGGLKLYGIENSRGPYDMGPYTFEEAKSIAKLMQDTSYGDDYYEVSLYNDLRNMLPAIERMQTPKLDKNGKFEDVDSVGFSSGDLADY